MDGVYRHRRPAIRVAREEAVKRYPGEYVHELRDINNNPDITNQELLDIMDFSITKLTEELKSKPKRK